MGREPRGLKNKIIIPACVNPSRTVRPENKLARKNTTASARREKEAENKRIHEVPSKNKRKVVLVEEEESDQNGGEEDEGDDTGDGRGEKGESEDESDEAVDGKEEQGEVVDGKGEQEEAINERGEQEVSEDENEGDDVGEQPDSNFYNKYENHISHKIWEKHVSTNIGVALLLIYYDMHIFSHSMCILLYLVCLYLRCFIYFHNHARILLMHHYLYKKFGTWRLDDESEEVRNLVQETDFGTVVEYDGKMLVDNVLVTAITERFYDESSSFHLPIGELIVTLDDVHNILGLPISGKLMRGRFKERLTEQEAASLFCKCLGFTKEEALIKAQSLEVYEVSLTWLLAEYKGKSAVKTPVVVARAYLIFLIG